MNEEETKCQECGAYDGHSIDCERKSPEQWRAAALLYYASWLKLTERDRKWLEKAHANSRRARNDALLWHGKYNMVKHENNALRKKLYGTKSKESQP